MAASFILSGLWENEIALYRQQSADMFEMVKLQAQRPIIRQTIFESKTVQGNDNSISIGGDVTGSAITAGDGNQVNVQFQQATLLPPAQVNIQAELTALVAILRQLNDPVTTGIAQKLETEAQQPNPDKSVVATTLETGLSYAKSLQGFAEAMDNLKPHVQNAAGWLGDHGHTLLPLVGLVL